MNGKSLHDNCAGMFTNDRDVIRSGDTPLRTRAGFLNLKGNLFDSALMKTSVISDEFRARYLSNPEDPEAFEGRAVVFDGPEDFHARIDDPALDLDEDAVLVIRGVGPIGYPGAAEVVNMRPPDYLLKRGIRELPCIGDGRQSGTSGSPSILNASPEAATGGGLALVKTGDRLRIDLGRRSADVLVDDSELARRRKRNSPTQAGTRFPRAKRRGRKSSVESVDELANGMVLKPAVEYQRIAHTSGIPRDNH